VIDKLERALGAIDKNQKEIILMKELFRGDYTYEIEPSGLKVFMTFLKENEATAFNMLSSVTGIDYIRYDDDKRRFGIVYSLISLTNKIRLNVRVRIPENNCRIDSVFSIWHSADWQEREIYDLYGILFDGHPDLRRILLDEKDYGNSHPLRKDYPLKGLGERHSPLKNYGDDL
jgi:NADH-quinone oxidoreductase subunit C